MALSSVSGFASFDQSAQVNTLDISPFLSEALILDFHLLGQLNVDLGNPVRGHHSLLGRGHAEQRNPDADDLAWHVGHVDHVHLEHGPPRWRLRHQPGAPGTNQEVMQVTTVNSATNATVSRGYNATTAASLANSTTVALMRVEQEFSDISRTHRSTRRCARTTRTSSLGVTFRFLGRSLPADGDESAMQDQVAHQLQNRMIEWKRDFTRILLYSEKVGPGSDTQYRSLGGLRYWIKNGSGQTYSTAGTFGTTALNTVNTAIVNLGAYPDTLVIGTDLVASVNAIEASNRRLLESDTKAGYMVNKVLLAQGNTVDVVVDPRVRASDAFLFCKDRVKPRPLKVARCSPSPVRTGSTVRSAASSASGALRSASRRPLVLQQPVVRLEAGRGTPRPAQLFQGGQRWTNRSAVSATHGIGGSLLALTLLS
jgi:hypothetical protein